MHTAGKKGGTHCPMDSKTSAKQPTAMARSEAGRDPRAYRRTLGRKTSNDSEKDGPNTCSTESFCVAVVPDQIRAGHLYKTTKND